MGRGRRGDGVGLLLFPLPDGLSLVWVSALLPSLPGCEASRRAFADGKCLRREPGEELGSASPGGTSSASRTASRLFRLAGCRRGLVAGRVGFSATLFAAGLATLRVFSFRPLSKAGDFVALTGSTPFPGAGAEVLAFATLRAWVSRAGGLGDFTVFVAFGPVSPALRLDFDFLFSCFRAAHLALYRATRFWRFSGMKEGAFSPRGFSDPLGVITGRFLGSFKRPPLGVPPLGEPLLARPFIMLANQSASPRLPSFNGLSCPLSPGPWPALISL